MTRLIFNSTDNKYTYYAYSESSDFTSKELDHVYQIPEMKYVLDQFRDVLDSDNLNEIKDDLKRIKPNIDNLQVDVLDITMSNS